MGSDFTGKIKLNENGQADWAVKDTNYKPEGIIDAKESRTEFKHDQDEIIYSRAFRRLSNKSQIVVKPEHQTQFRSRLTHTLEVNQIAESIGTKLKLNISLINAIAHGHDIGHSPFGHAGERELQQIVRDDILPLCDENKLIKTFSNYYQVPSNQIKDDATDTIKNHWLFHHALNSVRIIERKLYGVTEFTKKGIRTHSWSPWQSSIYSKFGIPNTYEAQVVAIADQIAGINHDTEDILSEYRYSKQTPEIMRKKLAEFILEKENLSYPKITKILEKWFLPKNSIKDNGFGRKKRLQTIINEIVEKSLDELIKNKVSSHKSAIKHPLKMTEDYSLFLRAYELYIREEVIKKVSWFRIRDSVAASVVKTVYNFCKYYYPLNEKDLDEEPSNGILDWHKNFLKSVDDDHYEMDKFWELLLNCSNGETGAQSELQRNLKSLDYVSAMTDNYSVKIHKFAFEMFE